MLNVNVNLSPKNLISYLVFGFESDHEINQNPLRDLDFVVIFDARPQLLDVSTWLLIHPSTYSTLLNVVVYCAIVQVLGFPIL